MSSTEVTPWAIVEKQHILATLEIANHNRTKASILLGISIRTLRNKIRAYRCAGEQVACGHLGRPFENIFESPIIVQTLPELEKQQIINTLNLTQGNRVRSSKLLGVHVRTIRNKISQYRAKGIDVPANPSYQKSRTVEL